MTRPRHEPSPRNPPDPSPRRWVSVGPASNLVLYVYFVGLVLLDALAEGNGVELRGFGAFSVKNRPARTGRNPRTGESVEVEEKWVPFFKTGKELRERLNGGK